MAHQEQAGGSRPNGKGGRVLNEEVEDRSGYLEEERAFPARPGEKQYGWEEPRVVPIEPKLGGATDGATSGVDPITNRTDRLRLLGKWSRASNRRIEHGKLYGGK